MRIAKLHERVPPILYGGTERVVSYLTEELIRHAAAMPLKCAAKMAESDRAFLKKRCSGIIP
ncbi:MAG TPA: hypothetical protein VGK77_28190 [Candidatus Binatia bacterium]|jgi:hypothetical protein